MKRFYSTIAAIALIVGGLQFSPLPVLAVDYTLQDVQAHNTAADCWTIVNGQVYNITSYITAHPGGVGTISGICGVNGSATFNAIHGSSASANAALVPYLIGNLIVADVVAPSIPAGLSASVISSSQINLSWAASTDNVAVSSYRIFRNGALVGTSSALSFSNIGLAPSTTYSFTVAALDAAGNISAQSAAISATTMAAPVVDIIAPSVPAGLSASVISSSQINLSWAASTDNVGVTLYRIFRNGVLVGTSSSLSFNNTGLAPATAYSFTVAALDAAGNVSAPSVAVSATTMAAPAVDIIAPSVPAGLSASVISSSRIDLSWLASTDNVGVTGYRIFRNGVLVGTSTALSFSNTGLLPSTAYSFTVAAIDAAGNISAPSVAASATTLATPVIIDDDDHDEDMDDEDEHGIEHDEDDDEHEDEDEDDHEREHANRHNDDRDHDNRSSSRESRDRD